MKILILGATARAAAFSTLRAGLVPFAADLFADRDLVSVATTEQISIEKYPNGLFDSELIDHVDAWMYTGALENSPGSVDQLAKRLPLMGISGKPLRDVRDPFELRSFLLNNGFSAPRVWRDPSSLETDGRWLIKPINSAAGRGVDYWKGGDFSGTVVFQRRVEGKSLSALFIGDRKGATLLGVSEQMMGIPGHPFAYRGSLGPWPVSPEAKERIEELGDSVGAGFKLIGLFGIDFLLQDDEPWVVEVNPRYTASVEVLELAYESSILAEHFKLFYPSASDTKGERKARRIVAKEILYAESPVRFRDDESGALAIPKGFEVPIMADIPHAGTCFGVRDPIVTVFGIGDTTDACRLDLEHKKGLAASFCDPWTPES